MGTLTILLTIANALERSEAIASLFSASGQLRRRQQHSR